VRRLQQATERLALYPDRGRPGRVAGTRELIVAELPFILAYRVRRRRVEILRVLHTSRRWPRRLP
jgi:toxin ParE1/3/4